MALSIRILGACGILLSHIVLVRSLGVRGFGEYAEAIAWLQVLCAIGKFGFDNTSLRYVSEYVARNETVKLQSFVRYSTRISVLMSALAMSVIVTIAFLYWKSLGDRLATCMTITALMIPLVSLRQIQEASLRGFGRMIESQISSVVWPMTLFLLAGTFWMCWPDRMSSPTAMVLHFISVSTVSALVYFFCCQSNPNTGMKTDEEICRRQWTNTAWAFLIAELLIAFKSRVNVIMAGSLLGSDSAGLYAAMERFADVSVLGSQSLGLVIAPQFASLYAAGRYADMRHLMRQGQILVLVSTLPVAIGVALFSDSIFSLLGSGYRPGWSVLITLLISTCIAAFAGPAAYVLQMTGRERTMLTITAMCAVTNIVFSLLFLPSFGILGLGISQIATSIVWTISVRLSLFRHQAWQNTVTDPIAKVDELRTTDAEIGESP